MSIDQEIRMARLEKQIETVEAENYSLRQKVEELEAELKFSIPTMREPAEVIGSWHKTKGNSE